MVLVFVTDINVMINEKIFHNRRLMRKKRNAEEEKWDGWFTDWGELDGKESWDVGSERHCSGVIS